jgi:hypothetical protein
MKKTSFYIPPPPPPRLSWLMRWAGGPEKNNTTEAGNQEITCSTLLENYI